MNVQSYAFPRDHAEWRNSEQSRELCSFVGALNHSAMGRKGAVMKIYQFAFVLYLTITNVFGQAGTSISGVVWNDGQPAKVWVIVERSGSEVGRQLSDSDGRFSFALNAGKYRVRIEPGPAQGRGLQGISAKNVTLDAGRSVTLRFEFTTPMPTQAPPSIEEFVTVSAGTSQTIDQVSKTVDVIDAQQMRDRADFSLAESLRTIPGFRVQQSGGFGRLATIKTRGLRNQDTALLIDGIRFRDASTITGDASSFLSDLTLTSVNKVEVLRGSGSSLYGTNAIGGTIDLQTPTAKGGTHGQISGAVGGLGLGRFRGNISHGTDGGGFGIGAGLSRTVYTKGIDGDDNAYNTNFQTRIDASPFLKTHVSARIYFTDAKVRLNTSPDTLGTLPSSGIINAVPNVNFLADQNDPDDLQRSRMYDAQLSFAQVINSQLVLRGYYSGIKTSRNNTNGPLGPGYQAFGGLETYLFNGQIHTINGHAIWTPRNHVATFGYEFELEKFENKGVFVTAADNFSTGADQLSNTFYAQDLVSLLGNKLQFSGAFRAQWFSLKTPTFSSVNFPNRFNNAVSPPASYTGDGSVSYYFERSGTKLRAHVGNGYRVPSLYERFGSYFFFNSFFGLGNPDLKPERSIAFDGGIEQSAFNDRIKLSATYFYTKINDEITYLPTDDLGAAAYYNFDKHFSRGLEFSGKLTPTRSTDIFASYTFTNSDVRNHRRPSSLPTANVASSDNKAFGVPDHQFTLVATQRFKRFWVNLDFLATSTYLAEIFSNSTFSNYTYRFKGNRKGDLTGGYTFGINNEKTTLRLYGTIENIFDHEYYENGFRTAKATGRVGLSLGF